TTQTTASGSDDTATPTPTQTETQSQSKNQSDKYGGRLTAGWHIGEMNQLDPHLSNLGLEGQVSGNIFNSLVTTTRDLKIVGDFAKDWSVKNAQQFTFNLREGVKVQKGYGELTAQDIKYTVNRALTLKGSLAQSTYKPLKSIENGGVKVLDDYKVQLNFKEPFAPGLASVGVASIIPKAAAEDMDRSTYKNKPVGAGPFKITEHKLGQSIKLDRFEDYYRTDDQGNQLPYLDGVDIDPIPEAATLISAIESGQVDFLNEVPAQNVSRVKKAQDVSVSTPPAAGWTGVQINTLREPFKNPKVRQAMAKTINREEFIGQAFFGAAEPALGPISPAHATFYREDKPKYQAYDPEKAKQLMKEAGAMNAKVNL
ncbi:MAG: ABC transporter substrate-binding protein, partial [Halobacteriaceae archaeon]